MQPLRRYLGRALALCLLTFAQFANSVEQSQLVVLSLIDGNWHPVWLTFKSSKPGKLIDYEILDKISNPSQITWNTSAQALFFEAEDGRFGRLSKGKMQIEWFGVEPNANLIQMHSSGDKIFFVDMMDGTSSETRLISYDLEMKNLSVVFSQKASQFYPYLSNGKLFYAHVSCRLACQPVVQDVWVASVTSQNSRQVTRLNSVTSVHSGNDEFVFISSNANGYYNLGRVRVADETVDWLTSGSFTDTHPSVARSGDLYFLRRDEEGSSLFVIERTSMIQGSQSVLPEVKRIKLPKKLTKLRYLQGNI